MIEASSYVMALVVSVLVLSIAGATLMMTIQGRSAQDAQAEDAKITACRSSLNVRLATGPTAKALKALSLEGVHLPAFFDAAEVGGPGAVRPAVLLSDSDPVAFLAECQAVLDRTG